jgi:hypothetical protein
MYGESLLTLRFVGLASYTAAMSPSLEDFTATGEQYVQAISEVNIALRHKSTALRDTTLLAVILLSYYESVTSSDDQSFEAWSNHINGTAALIERRGIDQMSTPDGRLLFLIATTNVIHNATRMVLPIPPAIWKIWRKSLASSIPTHDVLWRNHLTWFRLCDFYSDVMHHRKATITAVAEAQEIDDEFVRAFEEAPARWSYSKTPLPAEFASYGMTDYAVWYVSPLSAEIRTSMWCARIILHSLIRHLLRSTQQDYSPLRLADEKRMEQSEAVIQSTQQNIIASIPYYMNISVAPVELQQLANQECIAPEAGSSQTTIAEFERLAQNSDAGSDLLPAHSESLPMLKTFQGYNFIWALYSVAKRSPTRHAYTPTICKFLRLFGAKRGIMRAYTLADELENM